MVTPYRLDLPFGKIALALLFVGHDAGHVIAGS
jgi:hypothetical protein